MLAMALFSMMLIWLASQKSPINISTLVENKKPVVTGKVLFDGTSPATTIADGATGTSRGTATFIKITEAMNWPYHSEITTLVVPKV